MKMTNSNNNLTSAQVENNNSTMQCNSFIGPKMQPCPIPNPDDNQSDAPAL